VNSDVLPQQQEYLDANEHKETQIILVFFDIFWLIQSSFFAPLKCRHKYKKALQGTKPKS